MIHDGVLHGACPWHAGDGCSLVACGGIVGASWVHVGASQYGHLLGAFRWHLGASSVLHGASCVPHG